MIVSQSFQLGQTMLSLVFWGLPYILFVSPCMIIYLRLMAFITYRPINKGLDPKRETVVRKKTNLMTAGETMNLIVITGQYGGGWTTFIILDLCKYLTMNFIFWKIVYIFFNYLHFVRFI